jgi:two-component system phosphate regulon sensor histidine kinase PhoR
MMQKARCSATADDQPDTAAERERPRTPARRTRVHPTARHQAIREQDDRRLDQDLVALLSHELRAPISGLRSSAELLVDYLGGDLTSHEAQRTVRRIYNLSIRLSLMIQDLFDLAQCSSGRLETELAEIDLREAVASAVEVARMLPGMPVIAVDVTGDSYTVRGDSGRLSGVVLNLLANASKHAAQTSRIDVRIRASAQETMIDVEDYGPGIHPDDLPRVFCRHFQGRPCGPTEASSARRNGGLGLGLFIAQQIAQAHDGHLAVRSAVGSGTCFTLSLPRSRP